MCSATNTAENYASYVIALNSCLIETAVARERMHNAWQRFVLHGNNHLCIGNVMFKHQLLRQWYAE